jgi:MFS family permease
MGIIALAHGIFVVSMVGLTLAGIGWIAATPLFFTTTTEYLSTASAAGGIALISSLGNLGPAVGPSVTGWLTAQSGTPVYSMGLVMGFYLLSGVILLRVVKAARVLATH